MITIDSHHQSKSDTLCDDEPDAVVAVDVDGDTLFLVVFRRDPALCILDGISM